MDNLLFAGLLILVVAKSEELRDSLHFVGTTRSELPVFKCFVRVFAGVCRTVTSQNLRRVVFGIEADA